MPRSEQEVFEDLRGVCTSPGFAHALAFLCFRDNALLYGDEVTADLVQEQFSTGHLSRTEVSTLTGLLVSAPTDFSFTSPQKIEALIQSAEALLEELHGCLGAQLFANITPERLTEPGFSPWDAASAMREPIFYGGEAAYNFQYLHFLEPKYGRDDLWLTASKGFSISEVHKFAKVLIELQNKRLMDHFGSFRTTDPATWTFLEGFAFTTEEVISKSGLTCSVIEAILRAFSMDLDRCNPTFSGLSDFNQINATPIIPYGDRHLLFQNYTFLEAAYESPFFWMLRDKSYASQASVNRGLFAENLAHQFLTRVFGTACVWSNVTIEGTKGRDQGEIDVLAVYGNIAFIVQAKAKRLTLEARKGNDKSIRQDFTGAVQDAYDQGLSCGEALLGENLQLRCGNGKSLKLPERIDRVYPLCVLADHYPALAFQSRQYLAAREVAGVVAALIIDVFALDAITEMLSTPLYFLDYIDHHASNFERFMAQQELTILSQYIVRGFDIDPKYDMIMLDEGIASHLDVAMQARRMNVPGLRTPEGFLTRYSGTIVEGLIRQLERRPGPATTGAGLTILRANDELAAFLPGALQGIIVSTSRDGQQHDFTFTSAICNSGLTIHCNFLEDEEAEARLVNHCLRRKYKERSNAWYGLSIDPLDGSVRRSGALLGTWTPNPEMELQTSTMAAGMRFGPGESGKRVKVARNAHCPCGSGKKYKKCCGV